MSGISPKHLPQISAPFDIVLQELDDIDCDYSHIKMNPNDLNPSQPFTLSSDVDNAFNDIDNPIWCDNEMNIIDGHHKWVKKLNNDENEVLVIKLGVDFNNACRLLNKIQDIYEYKEKLKLEETTGNDYINDYNDPDSDQTESNTRMPLNDFLSRIEEDNELEKGEEKMIEAYRKEPIKDSSVVGNFFFLKPVEGYTKYEITFENLLDTNDLGIEYKDSQNPIDILAKNWFPHMNFKALSEKYNITEEKLKNKTIAEKARKLGFDGIKYGDSYLQGL